MSGVLNDCDAILQAAPVRVIANGLAAKVQEALDAAAAAQDDADAAVLLLADIASDGKLTPGEKPDLVAKRDIIIAEQAGVEAQAAALGVTTEKAAYTTAITALTTYLASAPLTGWNTIPGSTISITGAELRSKFGDVYAKKQALLNAITTATATRAVWANISGSGKPEDGASVGAPAGTLVNGVPVASITAAVTNFNAGNDRNATALAIPTILADGSAVDHTIRKDGSADVSFEWSWSGAEGDIDGFLVYVYQSTSSFAYTFGSTPALETVYTVPASKRAFILFGAAADLHTTFGVMAYRSVDKDVNATGAIKSPLVKPSLAAENPYRPSTSVAFAGDITGTINGTAVATMLADLTAAKAAADAANARIANISADSKLDRSEKPEVRLQWLEISGEWAGIHAQALSMGTETERIAYNTQYDALASYLTGLSPDYTDYSQDTPIDRAVFNSKFVNYRTAKQALLNAIAAKSATAPYLKIGGRNLYTKSSPIGVLVAGSYLTSRTATGFVLNGINANTGSMRLGGVITANGEYTLSFDLRAADANGFFVEIDICDGYGGNAWTISPTTTSQRFEKTFTVSGVTDFGIFNFIDFSRLSNQGHQFSNFMVEAGNKATSYTPAPEDVATDISTAKAAADAAQISATAAQTALSRISADNWLAAQEKPVVILEWKRIADERAGIDTQAANLGIGAERTAYQNAYDSLSSYLPAGWNDLTTDTPIVRTTFDQKFADYYAARQYLLNTITAVLKYIAAQAATTSTWAGTSGAGKPADYATVGAPYGTNVGSTSVALIEQRANSAIAAPTGFTLTGTFGGTVSTSATTIQTLSKQLNASASGAAGPVVYSWVINLVEGAGTYRISSTTDPNPVVTCTASNVATRIGVTCTATDTSTGLSRVNNGVINMNFGAI